MTILVTGGTGTLGRPTVAALEAAGREVRVFSRRPGPGRAVGDLTTGAGLAPALDGAELVLHLANGAGREAAQTRRLLTAAREAGVRHLVYISIIGVDRNPLPYYRQKLASEQEIERSDVPWTVLRASQFHDFVPMLVRPQLRMPFAVVPRVPLQPIAVDEVAARLAELAAGEPAGRVPDVAGPEQGDFGDFTAVWLRARGSRRRVLRVSLPGATFRAYREGTHLGELPGWGRQTFAEWVALDAERDRRATNGA